MRILLLTPLLALASPALAQSAPYGPAPYDNAIPHELTDPAMPAQLGRMAGALTKALMTMPIGEVQAAIEGRPTAPADRNRTIGSTMGGPGMERQIEQQVASSAGTLQSSARALQRAMPQIERALGQAAADIERATANLPDPTYPRR